MSTPFDRQASCPSCGAPMTFRFAAAAAQVCAHCRFVVARTDRELVLVGRMADLADIPTPLALGATGRWNDEPFVVDGRVQLDRAGAPGAPWQEFFVAFPESGRWCWVATAQGRWYSTSEVAAERLPPLGALHPGMTIELPGHGTWQVAEVGRRRVVSGEGEMPSVAAPGVATGYADLAGPGGAFGTIDYGDGQTIPVKLYLGSQIDPAVMRLDAGAPVAPAEAKVASLECPTCGGNLPLVTPGTTERVVCRYCGTSSDLQKGALVAMRQAPKPPIEPYIPLGAEGELRGARVICIGFVIRSTLVDDERFDWREYLLYAGPRVGYLWLIEEDGAWQLVTPIPPGDVAVSGGTAALRGRHYGFKQSVSATVDYVIGEFYWKVEVGERVQATEYAGPDGIVSVEEAPTEVTYSWCEPLSGAELAAAFGIATPPPPVGQTAGGTSWSGCFVIALMVLGLIVLTALGDCDDGGGSFGGPVFVGPSFGGK